MKPNTHIKQEMFIGRAQLEPDCFNGVLECSIRVFQFFLSFIGRVQPTLFGWPGHCLTCASDIVCNNEGVSKCYEKWCQFSSPQ